MWIRSGLGVSVLYNRADHTIWIWRDAWAHIRTNVVLPHYSLLTGQYQAKRVIRLVYVCSVSTSLLFIDRSVPSQESDPSCMCVIDRSVPSQESDPSCICVLCFYDFVLDLFRNCSDSVFYFHIITCNIPEHPYIIFLAQYSDCLDTDQRWSKCYSITVTLLLCRNHCS